MFFLPPARDPIASAATTAGSLLGQRSGEYNHLNVCVTRSPLGPYPIRPLCSLYLYDFACIDFVIYEFGDVCCRHLFTHTTIFYEVW